MEVIVFTRSGGAINATKKVVVAARNRVRGCEALQGSRDDV